MRIPESKIEEVRSASDIVDIVSSYLTLKKRGKNYLGLCPFHKEKSPSFNVSPDKQMYHCFGCGVGGNVFTFVMELEKVSFIEAVRTLADKAGVSLPSEGSGDHTQATENEALYTLCQLTARYYSDNITNTVEGKLALEYFHHRGFSDNTIREFGLGYSMHSWDALIKKAEQEKISVEQLDKAGLVVRREDGSGYYDRFRGRAMFPIFSASGRTIGFGARKMREDDPLGKYINSPETPIYNKSRSLYGIFHSKEAIREKEFAILVEGYADLISVFQAGIKNVVASSGTALTEEQIQLIGRYAKNITLVYDADSAGSKATIRGVDLVIENGLEVKIAALPAGEDPDSFVKKHGAAEFQKLLDRAISFLDFKATMFQSQGMLETPEGQTRAVRSIVETIAKMKDEIQRNFYIKSVAERYGIYENVLFRELEKLIGKERSHEQQIKRRDITREPPAENGEGPTQPMSNELSAPERDLLKLMLENGNDMVQFILGRVEPELFKHAQARRIVELIRQRAVDGIALDANSLVNDLEDVTIKHFIADLAFRKYELSSGWAAIDSLPEEADPWEIAERCVIILRRHQIDELIADNQRRMKTATAGGGSTTEYMERHLALLQKKKELDGAKTAEQRLLKK